MAHKILQPLPESFMKRWNAMLMEAWELGHAIWGFDFAQQPASERLHADGQDYVCFEVFNNAQSAGGGSALIEFIAKTTAALDIMRKSVPEGLDMEREKEMVLAPFQNHPTPELKIDPEDLKAKPN